MGPGHDPAFDDLQTDGGGVTDRFDDSRGLPTTAANALAVERYDAFVTRFMAHGSDAALRLKAVMEADPDLLLGHCARGFCFLILARGELKAPARASLAEARRILAERGGTARERAHVEALALLCDGGFAAAADRLAAALGDDPLDGYAVKLVHGLRFMAGDPAGMRAATAAVLPAWTDDVPGAGYVLGCHAFGLEETGALDEAERIGRKAVALARDDAWGFHAVAHVMEMRDTPGAGLDWFNSGAADISETGNLAFHIWWHKALFLLDFKAYEQVLRLYDDKVRCQQTDDFRDITNAVSLLSRLEGLGVDVGHRWDELAGKAANRAEDMSLAFAVLHYLMALVATGRRADADRMLAAMRAACLTAEEQARVFRTVALPYAEALLAGAPAGNGAAAERLAACIPDLPLLGGSRAQRDVFFRHAVDRLRAAGRHDTCRRLLAERLEARPGNVWANELLEHLDDTTKRAAE